MDVALRVFAFVAVLRVFAALTDFLPATASLAPAVVCIDGRLLPLFVEACGFMILQV